MARAVPVGVNPGNRYSSRIGLVGHLKTSFFFLLYNNNKYALSCRFIVYRDLFETARLYTCG